LESDTAYSISVLLPVIFYSLLFVVLFGNTPVTDVVGFSDTALYFLKFFWLAGFLVATSNMIGLVFLGNPNPDNDRALRTFYLNGWQAKDLLVVVYVSRGDNAKALERSVTQTAKLLDELSVNYRIDIVTDLPVSEQISCNGKRTKYHLVPTGYTTINGAKWKARALHYVVEQHAEDDFVYKAENTWILHLDEESVLTESCVAGVAEFIADPENQDAVGQGEIKYNAHNYGDNLLITWADSIRSGDDLGRFRFQYTLFNQPFFGMHGSYILAPLAIEQRFGF